MAFSEAYLEEIERTERYVLGAMIASMDFLNVGMEILAIEDFTMDFHRELFLSLTQLYKNEMGFSLVEIATSLSHCKEMVKQSIPSYLNALRHFGDQIDFSFNCDRLKYFSKQREVIKLGLNLSTLASQENADLNELYDKAESVLNNCISEKSSDPKTIGDVLESFDLKKDMDFRQQNYLKSPFWVEGIKTHFRKIDYALFGLCPGQMTVLGASTGVGKSMFGINLAINAAHREKVPCAYVSFEMSEEQIMMRALSSLSKVNMMDYRAGRCTSLELDQMMETGKWLSTIPFYIEEGAGLNDAEIRGRCRRLVQCYGVKLIIIDYIGLMKGSKKKGYDNKQAEIQDISRAFKQFSLEYNVHIMCLAQLNREANKEGGMPKMHHLRDSAALEHDADNVMILSRGEDSSNPSFGAAFLQITKNRNGPSGFTVKLGCDYKTTQFYDLTDEEE